MSKAFEEKSQQMQNEIKFLKKDHEASTANLKFELKRSQEMSKNLIEELEKSLKSQEESSKNLEVELRKSQEKLMVFTSLRVQIKLRKWKSWKMICC